MALRIFNNTSSNFAQRLLSQNSHKLTRIFARIASGSRLQKSADDSASMMTAEALKSDSRTLRQGIRNLNDGVTMLKVAEGGIQEESSLIIRMRELATQASTGTIGSTDRRATSLEFNAMRSELDRISKSTEYNGKKLLNGALSSSASEHIILQFGLDSEEFSRININREADIGSLTVEALKLDYLSIASQEGATKATVSLKEILNKLSQLRGRLGTAVNRLNSALNTTSSAAENLTAAQGAMNGADMAVEFAQLTKQQILVQSSAAMIGQSNLFPQGAIQLLP